MCLASTQHRPVCRNSLQKGSSLNAFCKQAQYRNGVQVVNLPGNGELAFWIPLPSCIHFQKPLNGLEHLEVGERREKGSWNGLHLFQPFRNLFCSRLLSTTNPTNLWWSCGRWWDRNGQEPWLGNHKPGLVPNKFWFVNWFMPIPTNFMICTTSLHEYIVYKTRFELQSSLYLVFS